MATSSVRASILRGSLRSHLRMTVNKWSRWYNDSLSREGSLHLLDARLLDDVLVQLDFPGDARPGLLCALGPDLEAGLVELVLHLRRAQHLEGFPFQPGDDVGRRLGRRQQHGVGREHEILVAG